MTLDFSKCCFYLFLAYITCEVKVYFTIYALRLPCCLSLALVSSDIHSHAPVAAVFYHFNDVLFFYGSCESYLHTFACFKYVFIHVFLYMQIFLDFGRACHRPILNVRCNRTNILDCIYGNNITFLLSQPMSLQMPHKLSHQGLQNLRVWSSLV